VPYERTFRCSGDANVCRGIAASISSTKTDLEAPVKIPQTTVAIILTMLTSAASAAVVVSKDLRRVDSVIRVSEANITGADMVGMVVTARFSDTLMEQRIWTSTGADSGGVVGTGWSLTQSGDTFDNPWTFTVDTRQTFGLTLKSFSLDNTDDAGLLAGSTPSTLFDSARPDPGTPGSSDGADFDIISGGCPSPNCRPDTAVYSHVVALGSASPVGDAFHRLDVTFAQGQGQAGDFQFILDTDQDERVRNSTVPEPASSSLVAAAALAAMLSSRAAARRGSRK
jgi:hypothetical protein